MKKFIVVAYFTDNAVYNKHAHNLVASLKEFDISFDIKQVKNLGSWKKNTQYKPTFIKEMMVKYPDYSIVYTDIDSVFKAYPVLFENIEKDVAAHDFNRAEYSSSAKNVAELLSGTLYFKNSPESIRILDLWIAACKKNPASWDQSCLQKVLTNYYKLPPQYCCIYDTMRTVKNPVIVHYQASREIRRLHKTFYRGN